MAVSEDIDRDPSRAAEAYRAAIALFDGGHSAENGPRALKLIADAASAGYADALAMSALFAAMGAGEPQDWHAALARLVASAEAGSDAAARQLRVLARPAARDDGESPSELAASIELDQLLAAPPREILSDSPRIVAFSGFASQGECDWAIARARDRLKPATVFDEATGGQIQNPVRNNSGVEFQLTDMDLVLEVLRVRISAATRLPVPIFEPMQILHYDVGEEFKPHHDFLDVGQPKFAEQLRLYGQRIGTVLVYLNDDYEGGETVFPRLGIRHRGRKGDALFFTNVDRNGHGDPMSLHAGLPPQSGQKWIISQWIRDRSPMSPFATAQAR